MSRRFRADADHAAKLAQIEASARAIGQRLAALDDERRAHAVAATVDGDEAAAESIKQIDAESDALGKKITTLAAAAEQVRQLEREAKAEATKQERARREAEAADLATAIMTSNGELDADMCRLREKFEKRAELLRQLGRLRVVSNSYIMRLLQKFSPSAAACHAGLSKFLSIEHVPVGHISTLVDSNSALTRPAAVEEDTAA